MPEIVKKNPVNEASSKPVKTHSKFTPNYSLYVTHQFGFNSPFFAAAAVAGDDISLRTNIDTDTYTLKAPVMQPVKRSVDYFQVPLRAILPRSAELIITNPLRGDDIIASEANAVLDRSSLCSAFNSAKQNLFGSAPGGNDLGDRIGMLLRFIQFGSLFFSRGSLINHLGTALHPLFYYTLTDLQRRYDWDDFVDNSISWIKSLFNERGHFDIDLGTLVSTSDIQYQGGADSVRVYPNRGDRSHIHDGITMREFMEILYDSRLVGYCTVSESSLSTYGISSPEVEFVEPGQDLDEDGAVIIKSKPSLEFISGNEKPVNILRLVAYQLANAEFYTSDTVDDVYSSRLYHDNMDSLVSYLFTSNNLQVVYGTINGIHHRYDPVCGAILNNSILLNNIQYCCQSLYGTMQYSGTKIAAYAYYSNIFGFQRSLKFQDYFVGSRTRPLAVGDVSVGVDTGSNTVDVIDVSKKIQVQRFLNQVNRVGRKFSEYVKGILGDKPMPDAHDPIFLGHVVDTIGAEETSNTADAQYSSNSGITSKFRSNANRFGFEVHVGEPSILIGILNYDLPRVYGSVTDREVYHIDRYEAFNPYMQFVGDQEVFQDELNPGSTGNFGYQIRYAEYRQRVDRGVGAFGKALPGYAKISEYNNLRSYIGGGVRLNSEFIRSHIGDIDEFYLSLTGFSLATYFHFIDRVDMSVTARRPMAFAPSIL